MTDLVNFQFGTAKSAACTRSVEFQPVNSQSVIRLILHLLHKRAEQKKAEYKKITQAVLDELASKRLRRLKYRPAQNICPRVILVDFNVITYCIGCIQAHNASHLQLLMVHNVLRKALMSSELDSVVLRSIRTALCTNCIRQAPLAVSSWRASTEMTATSTSLQHDGSWAFYSSSMMDMTIWQQQLKAVI